MSDVEITDNSDAVKEAFEAAIMRGLEKCGLTAEGYAKKLCPVDNGRWMTTMCSSAPTSNMPRT